MVSRHCAGWTPVVLCFALLAVWGDAVGRANAFVAAPCRAPISAVLARRQPQRRLRSAPAWAASGAADVSNVQGKEDTILNRPGS